MLGFLRREVRMRMEIFKFTNYAILDDDIGDMLLKQKDNVFEIDRRVGITKIDADKIIVHLNYYINT